MFEKSADKAHIVCSSSSFPGKYYDQSVLADAICAFIKANNLDFSMEMIKNLFRNVKVDGRYFRFPVENFCAPGRIEQTAKDAIETCVEHAEKNVRKLLRDTGLRSSDISQIVSVTLTPAVPSIEARLMNRIAFPSNMKRMPLAGLGCMAGVAGISRAADYLQGHPNEALILISCELSSALWQGSLQNDLSQLLSRLPREPSLHAEVVMSIVTAALFGDGSGAMLMVGNAHPLASSASISVLDNRSNWIPNTEHIMGLDYVDNGMRNILRPEVKSFVGVGLQHTIEPLLADFQISINDIGHWTIHPGGPKIMDAAEVVFGLSPEQMHGSRETLRKIGNVSSATVLCMLDDTIRHDKPRSGTLGMLVAMGPGFSQEAVLAVWR